jgi:hypothetical protein
MSPFWNAYVANLQMHGQGVFIRPAIDERRAVSGGGQQKSDLVEYLKSL